jgi:hypothetical protein
MRLRAAALPCRCRTLLRQVTKDGKRSAQFEHTFVVTETGVEILTERCRAACNVQQAT